MALHYRSLLGKGDKRALPQRHIRGVLPSVCCCDGFQVKRVLELDLLQLGEKKL